MTPPPLLIKLPLIAGMALGTLAQPKPLYQNDFEQADLGKAPPDMLVLDGAFAVKQEAANKYLELPGAPLDSFAVLFGPAQKEGLAVSARVYGTARGRRFPTFGVGLNGAAGYRLQVSPGRRSLDLYKGDLVVASTAYNWQSGSWTHLCLRVRKLKDGQWQVEGRVWSQDAPEPTEWMIAYSEKQEPRAGRAVLCGSPFSGTPIRYDDVLVAGMEEK
jgi:hypothetical protein